MNLCELNRVHFCNKILETLNLCSLELSEKSRSGPRLFDGQYSIRQGHGSHKTSFTVTEPMYRENLDLPTTVNLEAELIFQTTPGVLD